VFIYVNKSGRLGARDWDCAIARLPLRSRNANGTESQWKQR